MKGCKTSVEVATRGRVGELYGLLVSLKLQSFQDWDLYVLDESDNPSINTQYIRDTLNRLKCDGHNVEYQTNNVRKGIAAARNMAYKMAMTHAPYEYHVRIDDDSVCAFDYLQKLFDIAENGCWLKGVKIKPTEIGGVGGVVPVYGAPELLMNPPKSGIFNEVKIHTTSRRVEMADDGGYSYHPEFTMESHHLRSSFLYTTAAAEAVGLHSEDMGGSVSGFREETDFTMKIHNAGFKLITDVGAKCWHEHASTGGARGNSPQEYAQAVALNEAHFQRKWGRLLKLGEVSKDAFTMVED